MPGSTPISESAPLPETQSVAALLYGLLADATVGLVLFDADGRYVLVNDALAEINGVPAAAHTGRTPAEVVPQLAPFLEEVFERVRGGESIVNVEVDRRALRRPGPRTTLASFYPLRDAEGNVAGIGGVVLDITARKEAERVRDDALVLLDSILENAPVGLAFWDTQLRYQRVNAAMAETNGLPPEAHVGHTPTELFPDVAAQVSSLMRRVVEHGDVVLNAEISGETPAAPGVLRHWTVSYYPVRDAGGEIVGGGAVCTEVTDLRHARDSERYLRDLLGEERSVLRELVSRAPAGIVLLWGPEDRIRLANERFCQIAMLDEDPTGQAFSEVLPDLAPIAAPLLAEVRATRRPVAREDFAIPVRDAAREDAFEGHRYMSFSLDPVGGPEAEHSGILLMVGETTQRVHQRAQLEEELREERAIAATLQRALLPQTLPDIPGAAIAARYEAAGARFDVGGDFYDAVEIGDGEWMVVVGDVCGKGPEAAALTAMARYTLRAEAAHAEGPGSLLQRLGREFLRQEPDAGTLPGILRFATVACAWARPEPDGLHVRLACAGQPDPLVVRHDGAVARMTEGGPPCGVLAEASYPEQRVILAPGDALVLYTDGVLDAGAPASQLTIADVVRALSGRPPASAQDVAADVAALAEQHGGAEPRDDYAVLVLHAALPGI